MKHFHHKILAVIGVVVGVAFVMAFTVRYPLVFRKRADAPRPAPKERPSTPPSPSTPDAVPTTSAKPIEASPPPAPPVNVMGLPLTDALSRVTKKTFGLYVTKKNSPVQPERFTGYHSGVDFETTPNEQDADVTVRAICDGPLAFKRTASGYGGVAVQRCKLGTADVTVVYGHLRLSSISADVGDVLKAGQDLGLLGQGYSAETDGERKHLHLGIHKGNDVSIKGYVQTKTELGDWIDAMTVLR